MDSECREQADEPARGGSSTSRSMLDRLRRDDAQAWEQLVSLYAPLVYYWVRKSNVAEQEIPDIVQDVFQAVVANIQKFRKQQPGDTFRGWLRTIARNKVYDHFRRRGRSPAGAGGTDAQLRILQIPDDQLDAIGCDDEGGDDEAARDVEYALFHRALELIRRHFQSNTWQAFWRVVVDGRTPAEAADELGMRPGAVRVAKSRVLQRLRRQLGDVLE